MSSDSTPSVQVEGLGKHYVVPARQRDETRSTRRRLVSHLKEYFPALMGGDEQDRFWALRDVSFDLHHGEILGIIGKNGSGKSTLLKILAGVATPSEGRAILRGRVGSLLEVGTGFHPDLTGRENVYMNGALLGIRQQEIRAKFDEIVDFAGIGRFIDVPVKRYSSGMYVRLAYSVTSLLRSDVLILDEVLAVGDQEFRERSQRNMERAARDGRSVVFVSRNAGLVANLCHRSVVLDEGKKVFEGTAKDGVVHYLRNLHHFDKLSASETEDSTTWDLTLLPRLEESEHVVLEWVSTHKLDGTPSRTFRTGEGLRIRIGYRGAQAANPYFSILAMNTYAERVLTLSSTHQGHTIDIETDGVVECMVEDLRLGDGEYTLMLDYGSFGGNRKLFRSFDCVPNAARIQVSLDGYLAGTGLDEFQGGAHRSQWRSAR